MNEFEKKMAEVFDITPVEKMEALPVEKKELVAVNPETLNDDLSDAYQQTKENLQELIDQGKEAMEEILQVAKAGQHPRAFEVYGTLLKNVVDANKELLAVQKQMRDMTGAKKNDQGTTIDKAIFIGSTAELNKLIKGKE
jgi:DNA-binding ferritin-like protein